MIPTSPVILNAVKDPVFLWAGYHHPARHGGRGRPPSRWMSNCRPLASVLRFAQNDRLRRFLALFLALSALLLAPHSNATELTDLGQGLGYLRVHALDEAINPLAGSNDLVLDLRHTNATPDAAAQFSTVLSVRPAGSRLFVLVGPDTPAGLATGLKGNWVTLGIKDTHPEPQVMVDQSAVADRAAYDALESGATIARLISGRIEKERFDEASLVQEFKNGNHDAHPPETGPAKSIDSPPVLTDRVLQRAVHLHRALLALKR